MNAKDEIEYLREQLNAVLYLQAESWMLPSWADLTLKGVDREKKLIRRLSNNSYRNWSLVGGVGSKRYGISDSRGLSMALADCGSLEFWVQGTDGIIFPALLKKDETQLSLVSTEDQLYEWKTDVKSVNFTRLLYHVEKDDIEYLFNEIVLKNIALEDTTINFYAVIRPMSVLGFEAIENLEFDSETNCIFANGILALKVDIAPTAVYLFEANNNAVLEEIQSEENRYDSTMFSKLGLATAVLKFSFTLPPAGFNSAVFASPLEVLTEKDSLVDFIPKRDNRDNSIGTWYNFTKKRCEAQFPDEKLDNVFAQAAASLAIQSYSVQHSSSSFSWMERARVLTALIKSGGIDVASRISLQTIQTLQDSEIESDFSVLSPLLWTLLTLQGYSLQKEPIQEFHLFTKLLAEKLISLLLSEQTKQEFKQHPTDEASIGVVEDAPLEHYRVLDVSLLNKFNESLWTLAALHESYKYFSLSEVSLGSKIKDIIPDTELLVQELFTEIQEARWPRPQEPLMYDIDRAILDILTSIVQLRIKELDGSYLQSLCKKVSKRRLIRNLWKVHGPTEFFSSHLALRLAQFHVWDKQRDKAGTLLQRSLEFLSEDYLLPDYVNLRTFGGSGGSGASAKAATDIILLLNDMLAHEDQNNLVFLVGIPSDWFAAKKPLTVRDFHTKFGKAHIDIGQSANQHQIETGMEILPDEIEIHVPDTVPLRMVKVYGGSIVDRVVKDHSPHLKLIPLSNDIVLTYPRW